MEVTLLHGKVEKIQLRQIRPQSSRATPDFRGSSGAKKGAKSGTPAAPAAIIDPLPGETGRLGITTLRVRGRVAQVIDGGIILIGWDNYTVAPYGNHYGSQGPMPPPLPALTLRLLFQASRAQRELVTVCIARTSR